MPGKESWAHCHRCTDYKPVHKLKKGYPLCFKCWEFIRPSRNLL